MNVVNFIEEKELEYKWLFNMTEKERLELGIMLKEFSDIEKDEEFVKFFEDKYKKEIEHIKKNLK